MPALPYTGRFAPSPTGPLHAGSLVAALASWLDARAHGGRWLVRIEDVDTTRCVAGVEATILQQLQACGLMPDEPPWRQRERGGVYEAALAQLRQRGQAYPCGCTRSEIEIARPASALLPERHAERPYPGTCRHGLRGKAARVWRLRANGVQAWHDRRLGPQQQDVGQAVGDFVLRRADGLWAYQLAVVVDDAAQRVTHVVRGQDLADNTARQIDLQQALGLPTPNYLHTPLVRAGDGHKLSKQNGAAAVDLRHPVEALRSALQVLDMPADAGALPELLQAAVPAWRQRWVGGPAAPSPPPALSGGPGPAAPGPGMRGVKSGGPQSSIETNFPGAFRMTPQEQRGLLAVALMAAFADGQKADAEREEIKRIAESLGAQAAGLNVSALLQDVLLKRITLAQAVADLQVPEHRQLAYELALGVCDADGAQSPTEMQFLAALRQQLGADAGVNVQADALAAITDAPASVPVDAALQAPAAGRAVDRAALDGSVKNYAMLCGALELLPQSWASMAIIPLQVKMVYGIGQAHGAALDASMVKEFIAAAGVGLTSQYVEQFGRKLLGGLLGKVMGGMGRGVGSAGAGMAMSFATTYALGQLAVRYYGGGRQMNTQLLRDTYQSLLGPARQMQSTLLPQIQERARTLDVSKVLDMVRQPLPK